MSKLLELLESFSPEGVDYYPLEEVFVIKKGYTPSRSNPDFWVKDGVPWVRMNDLRTNGHILDDAMEHVSFDAVKGRPFPSGTVIVATTATIGEHALLRMPALCNQQFTALITNTHFEDKLLSEFVFYYCYILGEFCKQNTTQSSVASVNMRRFRKFLFPVPPIEIQREIIRVLDVFNDLERNLASELKLRRKQFAQIRSTFVDSAGRPMVPLESISRNLDNQRVPISQRDRVAGDIPYYGASGIVDYVADYIFDGDYLLISEDGANLRTRVSPIAFSITGRTWVNNHAHVLEFDSYYVRKFVEHYINDTDLSAFVSGGAQPKLNQRNLNSIPIPVYTEAEMKSVVNKLDALEALIRSIEDEISLRRKQYGYYRDELFNLVLRKA